MSVFLEQLRDAVKPSLLINTEMQIWLANKFIDCQNSIDPITIDPDAYFDVTQTADLEDPRSLLEACKASLNPDLIISNPPYGVKVVAGMHYDQVYDLQSDDSYGYFIYNAILRLPEGRRLIFIISSSFLTIKSHFKLRKFILENAKIIRIIKLHRATFPGIDIFPVIIELEKAADISSRENNYYQFYDLWQLHPVHHKEELRKLYQFILSDLTAASKWAFDNKNIARYVNRQGIINSNKNLPIFDGSPSLFDFMDNVSDTNKVKLTLKNLQGIEQEFYCKEIRGIRIIPLGNDYEGNEFGTAKQGLIPPSVRDYYRICPGVKGGAVKGGYIHVDLAQALTIDDLVNLSGHDRRDGIEVNDLSRDKFYLPIDKAGAADIEGKILKQYYSPVEYYVNWSKSAVLEMKSNPKGRFQNSNFYFQRGISYSDTGIYSPTFRISFGSVFDQKASVIFNGHFSLYYLLGVLNAKLIKYFVKVFINHSVSAQVDSIKEIPIVIQKDELTDKIEGKVSDIINSQRTNPNYDYYEAHKEIDALVYQLYNLTEDEIVEVESWYDRKYPKLRRDIDTTNLEES